LKLFEIFISLESLYAAVRTICIWGVKPAAHMSEFAEQLYGFILDLETKMQSTGKTEQ